MSNIIPVAIDIETSSESGKKDDNLNHLINKIECIAIAGDFGSEVHEAEGFWFRPQEDGLYIMHNAMFDMKVMAHHFEWSEEIIMNCHIFDTYVAARLIDENAECGLKELAKKYLGKDRSDDTYKIVTGRKNVGPDGIEVSEADMRRNLLSYCQRDAEDSFGLYKIFKDELERQNLSALFKLEMEVVKKMICAELRGVRLDIPRMSVLQKRFSKNRNKLRTLFINKYKLPDNFNLNSPKQLCKLFFDDLKVQPTKKTPNGTPSTDAKTLEEMAGKGVDAARWLLTFRKYEMVERQTVKLIESAEEGRVHTNFNIVGTESGRFSSSRPNLQQIAAKSRMGMAIRSCFIGDLIVADFDNVELRLLAHFSGDPILQACYRKGDEIDVHQQTADLLGVTRSQGKVLNFGILYGMGPQKLSQDLKIDIEQAKWLLDSWFENYSYVKEWKDRVIYEANIRGYVTSLSGRRRHVPELIGCLKFQKRDRDQLRVMYGLQREVVNFILQGSSADITKKAICELRDENIILQIHDELVIDEPKRSVDEIKHILDNLVDLAVPITATVQRVSNWAESKDKSKAQKAVIVV